MGIIRVNELPEGSGSLTNDDIFLFMDDPSGSGVTKKISLSQISSAIGGGGDLSAYFNTSLIEGSGISFVYDSGNNTLSINNTASLSGTEFTNLTLTNKADFINYFVDEPITFTHTDNGDEIDIIGSGLSITRGENGGIYNPEVENGWDDGSAIPTTVTASPQNTEWNSDGWNDLTNVNARTYTTFYASNNNNIGNNVLSRNFIMHDTVNDKYYKIDFTVWGNAGAGAPVTYTRQQIDATTGDDIGSLVTFTKLGYADPFLVKDDIDTGLSISRGNNQGIFNTELENSWAEQQDVYSPVGTEWNVDGFQDLGNVKTRIYKTFYDVFNQQIGQEIVGSECIMHDTINDKYYAIRFTSWTGQNNGGGFSYIRQEINTDIVFVHTENGSEVDDIADGIGITRDSGGAIYNPYDEGSWDDDYSPGGTLWNFDGFQDLSDVETRSYTYFYAAMRYWGIGNKIDGAEAVMYVPSNGTYYTIKFLSWQRGGGGAFSYIRTPIDLSKKNEGIRFADGTVQKTSAHNVVKFRGPFDRSIQEYYGYGVVDITRALEYNLNETVKYNINDSTNISVTVDSTEIQESLGDLNTVRNISVSLDNGASWVGVRHGGYGNDGGYYVSFYVTNENDRFTASQGDAVIVRYWRGGIPQLWFDPDKSPGGYGNFRGAIIDYHAYSQDDGTIIGQIMVSCDGGDYSVTHSESMSGSSDLSNVVLWYSQQRGDTDNEHREGQLYAYKLDGDSDTIKIQWRATMFYGHEFWD